ncbi:MAG: hypothetical protein GWN99_02935 [Gemmatimonadetes bacterium]|uniref:Uncharacterized protein n=1 Tax=Candidatus Kutchimonas denitrificans TaxID=3056748 RepID=A0AAE5C8Y0_9BACT|nr:hypothetical protein [Gemmatimonadota bacterium]NIR74911.1 hypothetical protein [Candidatus Kutchimonas denitrificans]NIS00023.1 hypothetical protein [Gemmatimonadota bacterium]NIT65606.1 hypothetical protein [Gemmatimonadota bacterium]NIU52576.1 hypothetical protein [Gemmatimonadota bacterium]
MTEHDNTPTASRPVAVPAFLCLIAATHFSHAWIAELRGMPVLPPAVALGFLLGLAYAWVAWLGRRGRGFRHAINLVVGEDLGFLAAGLVMGYPWAEILRPGTAAIVAFQFALVFPEIWRRQERGQPIVAPARLAWFILAYALAFGIYALVKPRGFWNIGSA